MQLVILLLNSLGLVGLGWFLWFVWTGLKDRIKSLRELTEEQGKTLAAVRERAEEFDRLSQRYKQALTDFEEMGTKTETRRKQLVVELEDAVRKKDAEIIALKRAELEKVQKEQESLAKIPELFGQIDKLQQELRKQAKTIKELDPLSDFHAFTEVMTSSAPAAGWNDLLARADEQSILTSSTVHKIALQIAESAGPFLPKNPSSSS